MPEILLDPRGFPAQAGLGIYPLQNLTCTWPQLVWSAITVGRGNLRDVFQHRFFSFLEVIYRSTMLYANLREDNNGIVSRSPAYEGLDPSEKGAVSYFIGLTAAKLCASKLFRISWLMHRMSMNKSFYHS